MNKKVLTLCASFLLAGGLTSQAFASVFHEVTDAQIEEGQYFYVFNNPATQPNLPSVGTTPDGSSSGVLDVNGIISPETVGGSYWSKVTNRETWWRVEKVITKEANGMVTLLGYKLINALTGEALSVKDAAGNSYETFLPNTSNNGYAILMPYTADGSLLYVEATGGELTVTTTYTNALHYNLQPVETETLTASEANKVIDGAFGLQFGYINEDGEYVNYVGLNGAEALSGTLVAKSGDDLEAFENRINGFTAPNGTETFCIYNESAEAYVVLLKDKWSTNNTNHDTSVEGNGHRFDLMTAREIIEDQNQQDPDDRKIASFVFQINMPVNMTYSPLEVVVKDAVNGKDVELYIANMDNKNYLTTTLAGDRSGAVVLDDADKKAYDDENTVVRFSTSDYINFSDLYGYAITIKGLAGTGVEGMTLLPNKSVSPTASNWERENYIAFSRPEAQWIVTNENARIVLTNRETKESTTWTEVFNMLDNSGLSLRHESGDNYIATVGTETYRFEIKKVAELGGESKADYGVYSADETSAGITRNYKVTFTDNFGTTSYVGMDGLGNVLLTRNESAAINFDLVKTQTTDSLKNDGTIDENVQKDVFYIVNDIMAKNKDGEWEYKAAGDTLTFFRYKLAYGDKYLTYNENKDQFELINEDVKKIEVKGDAYVDYAASKLADNFIVKLKENDKMNIVKVINYEMDDILAGKYYDGDEVGDIKTIYELGSTSVAMFDNADLANNSEGEKLLLNGEMMFFDFNNAEVQKQQNIYAWNANAQLTIAPKEYASYRYFANPDTVEIYRVEYSDEFLFEHGNILGMTYNRDMYNPSLYLDTAFVRNDTKKPTYMLAVAPEFEPNHTYCPLHGLDADCPAEHLTIIPGYTTARYLVSYTDSVAAHAAELKNEFLHEGQYTKLGFVDAVHRVDSVFVPTMSEENKKAVITEGAILPYTFAFRIVNPETQSFYIEAAKLNDEKNPNSGYKSSWMAWINGCPVLTDDITLAEEFNVREGKQAPTANETIEDAASAISVIATDGAVIVKGAEGKNVIVSTILGKVVANETVNSDNETIAAPAGIVVVSVDGESFKVAVK